MLHWLGPSLGVELHLLAVDDQGPVSALELQSVIHPVGTGLYGDVAPLDKETGIVVQDAESVEGLCEIIRVGEVVPDGHYLGGHAVDIHAPEGHVEQVDTPVGNKAAAVVPEHPPGAMEPTGVERPPGCRPKPHVEVDTFGDGSVLGVGANGRICKIGPDIHPAHMPELPAVHDPLHLVPQLGAALLLPDLDNPAVALLGGHHGVTLGDAVRRRLLHVDVLPC